MTAQIRESIRSGIVQACREFIGNDGVMTVADLAQATGISERAIKSYQQGPNVPPTDALLMMMQTLGPAFSDRIQNIIGHGGVIRLADNEHADPDHLAASAAGLVYEHAQARATGKLCHRTLNSLRIRAHALMARCNGFIYRMRERRAAA